ncbi:MAG: magnesium transporter [Candidatus Binatia bacterium]
MTPNVTVPARAVVSNFFHLYPHEAAMQLERLPVGDTIRLLAAESPARAVKVFERLATDYAERVLVELSDDGARRVLSALDPALAAALLARLDPQMREQRLALLDPASVRELRVLMTYPPDSAGSLMDPRVMTFRPELSTEEALARLRTLQRRPMHDLFLVDVDGRLVGILDLQDVAVASATTPLANLRQRVPACVPAIATREEVVEELTQRKLTSLPVIDAEGRVIGVLHYDTLVEAVQDEASADIQTMVGASKEERALSPPFFAVRKRLPWLQINLATAFLAASVVGVFEETISRFTALAVLLPVVAGQSGNTGAQALAVTMRGLAIREIRTRQWLRVSLKEVAVAVVNGIAVAATTSLGVYLWSQSVGLALVIGVSMVISMAVAGLAGAAIPIVLTSLNQDPAQSSSIILTTVTDVVGFFSFLGIATALAGML